MKIRDLFVHHPDGSWEPKAPTQTEGRYVMTDALPYALPDAAGLLARS